MEKEQDQKNSPGNRLHESLQGLIGLHRQLYEIVKHEHEAITQADTKATYEAVANKEALLHWIHQAELERQALSLELKSFESLPDESNPTLKELIIHYQVKSPELASRLQADLNALVILVERVKKQNQVNGSLISQSLKHINNMKGNIFGETTHQGKTYNQLGQKNQAAGNPHGPRLISKEV
ncbi:MAG: flagellar export chaperone FlgN [Bdellovibrionales bacterium]|nr:flagellar export chaperone FlgN [Bdellovibrionales bacterium]